MEIISIPAIAGVVLCAMQVYKKLIASWSKADLFTRFIPAIAAVIGAICGWVIYYAYPDIMPDGISLYTAIIIGGFSGWSATGIHQTVNQHVDDGENNGS